ncbi:MAG: hypothetical protein JNK40_12230 [Chromatiales bacterium]|nr:hypothetical protein [Chromatiales bacterium]
MHVIPACLRVLAGLVAAAAAMAILLLVRDAHAQILDGVSFVGLAARAILFLGLVVLFGYVAATGLPPAHWWRSAGQPLWPLQPDLPLTPDLQRFLAHLRARHPGIRECWLLDSARQGEWRLLAVGDPPVLDAVRGDWDIRRRDVRLYLVDGPSGTVALAWGRSSPVAFATWDWEPQRDELAEFRCPVAADTRLATRLWSS